MFFEIKFKGRHTFSQKDTWYQDKQLQLPYEIVISS